MVKTTTVGQRFSQLIQALGMSKNAFALSLDKTATVIQHIVEERNKPGFDLLCKVFEVYPNVSKDWVLEGVGQMYNTPTSPKPDSNSEPALTSIQDAGAVPAVAAAPPAAMPVAAEPEAPTAPPAVPATAVASAAPAAPAPVAETAVPAAPAPVPAAAPAPLVAAAPVGWEAALYAQQLQHQLALAELRNQHLLEQQKMLQQMVELLRPTR